MSPRRHRFPSAFVGAGARLKCRAWDRPAPGVYHLYDVADALLYVGKARDLRRRLAQYRTTRRTKKDRKRRALVRSAHRIVWQVCASELEASLTEIRLIQALRPRENVAGAFPFLYPTPTARRRSSV